MSEPVVASSGIESVRPNLQTLQTGLGREVLITELTAAILGGTRVEISGGGKRIDHTQADP